MTRVGIYSIVLILAFGSISMAARWAVSVEKGNIRSGPGPEFDVIWQVEKYYPVDVIDRKGDWRYFRDLDGDEGWINASILNKTETVVVKRNSCNIRSGPGTKYKVAFIAEKGIPFKVLKRKEHWILIEHADGDKGWILDSLVW
jgi:SH3-like domain-containing protein